MLKEYFEYHNSVKNSHKFWEITRDQTTVSVRWGRIHTQGQQKEYHFRTAFEALRFYEDKRREKLDKGYRAGQVSYTFTKKEEKEKVPDVAASLADILLEN